MPAGRGRGRLCGWEIVKMAKKKKKKKKKTNCIGKWGNLTFVASRNKQRTFSEMKWTSTYNFDVKDRKKKVSKVLQGIFGVKE